MSPGCVKLCRRAVSLVGLRARSSVRGLKVEGREGRKKRLGLVMRYRFLVIDLRETGGAGYWITLYRTVNIQAVRIYTDLKEQR